MNPGLGKKRMWGKLMERRGSELDHGNGKARAGKRQEMNYVPTVEEAVTLDPQKAKSELKVIKLCIYYFKPQYLIYLNLNMDREPHDFVLGTRRSRRVG